MSLEADLDASILDRRKDSERRHDEAMKGVILKKAKIEAKRDVKVARSRSDSYLTAQCVIALFVMVAVFIICAYGSYTITHMTPKDSSVQIEQQKSNDARYMACLAKGWDFDTSNNQCNQP